MVVKLSHLVVALLVALGLVTLGTFLDTDVYAQSRDVSVIHMVGDNSGTWLFTTDNRLIYCWWPSSPSRTERTASCRVMDQFRVNMMR